MWGRLAACGGLLTRVVNPWERRLTTGAQLTKLPHKKNMFALVEGLDSTQELAPQLSSRPAEAQKREHPCSR